MRYCKESFAILTLHRLSRYQCVDHRFFRGFHRCFEILSNSSFVYTFVIRQTTVDSHLKVFKMAAGYSFLLIWVNIG